ncbi:T6SS effector amidase Tae4 family protein, partial [Pseudoalteromonas luteoviolacea]
FVQAPTNLQNYNAYSYVLNNPLSYTDPSGYFFKPLKKLSRNIIRAHAKVFGAEVTNIMGNVGSLACLVWAPVCAAAWNYEFTRAMGGSSSQAFKAGLTAAATTYAFQYIGEHFSAANVQNVDDVVFGGAQYGDYIDFGGNLLTKGQVAAQITAHATVGGIAAVVNGGKFGHGFVSAGVTKGAGGVFLPGGSNLSATQIVKGAIISAVIGGTVSEITGGKFSNGARTGAMQYVLNQVGEWSYKKLSNAYQSRWDMMEGKKFQKWAENAILSSSGGSCAARVSNAFNRAGYNDMLNAFKNTDFVTTGDGQGNRYILGAQNLALYLGVYDNANLVTNFTSIKGKQGIIFFRDPSSGGYNHIDLFDGSKLVGNGVIPSKAFKSSIYFSELKD